MNAKRIFQKTILAVLVAALMVAALPLTGVSAAGLSDPTQPPANGQGISSDRLEHIWSRMLDRYDRMGKMFDSNTPLIDHAEKMIDRLKQNGKPTADLEAALKAFEDALKQARPIYESCSGILNSHKGFDANGKVTDSQLAKQTVRDLGEKLLDIRDAMNGTGKALTDLMKSIRNQYRPTPTPTSGF